MKTRTKLLLENAALLGGAGYLLRKKLQGSVFPLTSVLGREPDELNKGIPAGLDAAPSTSARSTWTSRAR